MFNILIKLLVSKLHNIFLLVALTGFVCTYKIQAEEECLSSNILCYECDSRYDPDCADPFELASMSLAEQQTLAAQVVNNSSSHADDKQAQNRQQQQQAAYHNPSHNLTHLLRPKQMPHVAVCHGCCVKITSKAPEGATYVKRTCTTNLQINYFMVGLVCMKESGDRGKMCFCETDYCNGQEARSKPPVGLMIFLLLIGLLISTFRVRG